MLPLVVNEFDLSVASVMGFAAMLTAGLSARQGFPTWLVFVTVIAFGLAIGGLHALLIVKFKLPSFIVTLGTNSVLIGIILLYSGGAVIYDAVPEAITFLGTYRLFGIGLPVYILFALVIVLWFLLEKRPVGRMLYAVGSNEEASRLAGIKTGKVRAWVMVSSSLVAVLAGVLLTARVGSASPTTFNAFFLPAFAAAFLSLAAYKPGQYNPLGVVTAVYLIGVGISGLSLLGVPSWMQPVFHGVALVIAIALSKMLTKGGGRSITPP
jgi:ribose transport system permease protein